MNRIMYGFAALPLAAGIGSADAAVVADGQLASDTYGPILFVQDTPTGFGDNTNPSTTLANGSEIDGVYATVEDGNLNVLVTGNLETNFNRLVLYIDSESGGQNTLDASTGGPFNSYSGLTFDTGFGADYGLVINGGNDPAEFFLDFGDIGSSSTFVGQSAPGANTFSASNGINVGIDQSNVAGVTETSASGAAAVTTGLEFVIPLSVIGSPTDLINVAGFVAGGDFVSNQVIGGVNGAGNLGPASGVNFSNIAGDQFVTVAVPEPASLALLGLGTLLIAGRRRSA